MTAADVRSDSDLLFTSAAATAILAAVDKLADAALVKDELRVGQGMHQGGQFSSTGEGTPSQQAEAQIAAYNQSGGLAGNAAPSVAAPAASPPPKAAKKPKAPKKPNAAAKPKATSGAKRPKASPQAKAEAASLRAQAHQLLAQAHQIDLQVASLRAAVAASTSTSAATGKKPAATGAASGFLLRPPPRSRRHPVVRECCDSGLEPAAASPDPRLASCRRAPARAASAGWSTREPRGEPRVRETKP